VNREAHRLPERAAVIPLIQRDMLDYRPQNLQRAEENNNANYLIILDLMLFDSHHCNFLIMKEAIYPNRVFVNIEAMTISNFLYCVIRLDAHASSSKSLEAK